MSATNRGQAASRRDHRSRREALAVVLAGLVLPGCSNESNAPPRGTRFSRRPRAPSVVDDFSRVALSPDGRLLAVNFSVLAIAGDGEDHFCHLAIVDLNTRRAWFLSGPPRVYLDDPRFSHDGLHLYFIGTPSPYFGVSQVYRCALSDLSTRPFGEPGRFYGAPCPSADGSKIVCSRDSMPQFSAPRPNAWAADQEVSAVHLYEFDTSSGRGRRLSSRNFSTVYRTAYDPLGRGVFFSAGWPVEWFKAGGVWQTPWGLQDYEKRFKLPRNFLLPANGDLPPEPAPFAAPERVGTMGAFDGVTDAGAVLIRGVTDAGVSQLVLVGEQTARVVHVDQHGISGADITPDGRTLVSTHFGQLPNRPAPPRMQQKQITVVDLATGSRKTFGADEIRFSSGSKQYHLEGA